MRPRGVRLSISADRRSKIERKIAAAVVILLMAAAALFVARQLATPGLPEPVTPAVIEDGVAPFRLGADLTRAAGFALPFDQAASYVGPGCDDRDQVTVILPVGAGTMTVMAMADQPGIIGEIIATPSNALIAPADRTTCMARTRGFADSLTGQLGSPGDMKETRQPVSDEFRISFGAQAQVVGRWFPGGRTCDLALIFKRELP